MKSFFYTDSSINKLTYPQIKAMTNKVNVIKNEFLMLFLSLNKYNKPKPALDINPAKVAEKQIISETNKSLIITLDAQFGINPTNEESKGVK